MEIKVMSKLKLILVVGFLCGLVFSSQARKEEITLILVPRNDATIQLGLDIANRYPTLLVSYKLAGNGAVSLHGWTGTQWVNITSDDFAAGNFFKNGPDSALMIEKEHTPVPDKLVPPADWCMTVSKITTTQTRPVLHLVGQYYDFGFKDWQWFATRYNMDMDAINPEGLNISWFHKRMEDHLKSRDPQGVSDLQFWVSIRQAVTTDPVVPVDAEVEEAAAPSMEEESENPLTNAAPAAVIMGAADAPEEHSAAPSPADETASEDKAPEAPEAPEEVE
jgi:hypothetical protein